MLKQFFESFFKENKDKNPLNGKNILVVEDDVGQRLLIHKILEKNGYGVMLAEDGSKGLAVARARKPDLILLDVVMPGISGREVCSQLKAEESTKNIPVIFLTSADSPNDVVEQFELGADMHLAKPIDAKALISQIEITFES